MSLVFRPVRPADRAFLLRLYTEVRDDLAALPLPEAGRRQMIEMQFLAQDRAYAQTWPGASHDIVVAEGRDVGQLRLNRGTEALHSVDLSLLAAARGQGIGTRILHGMQAEAAQRGLPVRLSVMRGNPAADLYRRTGFVQTGDMGTHLVMEWRPQGCAPS